MKKNKISNWIYISIGGILFFLFSFTIIYNLLIPDVCYYHTHKMNLIMNLFYSAGPADNGHPEPNLLNFIFSFFIGGLIGNEIHKYKKKVND